MRGPIGKAFSAKISTVTSAITAIFMIPSGKRIKKRSQQHPRQ